MESEPPWGPISRAREPEDWYWWVPGYDELRRVMELLAVANAQRGGAKRHEMPEPATRPWEKKKLNAVEVPTAVIDARLDAILPRE